MTKKPFVALALCAGLTMAVFAASGTPAKKSQVTVGEFAVKVASALGYETRDQKVAQKTLRGMGVNLAADLNAPLTEGAVAKIMTDLGVSVMVPSAPETPVSSAKAGFLAGSLAASSFGTETQEPPQPIEPPTECLQAIDRGTCVNCCKDAVGMLTNHQGNPRDAGKECSKFCKAWTGPIVSDEEPQP
jgi:hypothetical protein